MKNSVVLLVVSVLAFVLPDGLSGVQDDLSRSIDKLQWSDPDEGEQVVSGLIAGGEQEIRAVIDMLVPPGKGDDSPARFALHGAVIRACRPGAEAERKLLERALLDALSADHDPEINSFLIAQLQIAGGDASVGPLSVFLTDKRLCEPAVRALIAVGTPEAGTSILEAARNAGPSCAVTLVRALGRLPVEGAVDFLIPLAGQQDDADLRHVACYALSEIGDPRGASALAEGLESGDRHERSVAGGLYLKLGRQLLQQGNRDDALRIAEDVLAAGNAGGIDSFVCGGLELLVDASGVSAMPRLLDVVQTADMRVAGAALALAEHIPGEEATRFWITALDRVGIPHQVAVLSMLGRRQDRTAVPALNAAAERQPAAVRIAAMEALVGFGWETAAPALLKALQSHDPEIISAAESCLTRLDSSTFAADLAEQIPFASPKGRILVAELLAARGATDQIHCLNELLADEDAAVRVAAARAMGQISGPTRVQSLVDFFVNSSTGSERTAARNALAGLCTRVPEAVESAIARSLSRAGAENRSALLSLAPLVGGESLLAVAAEDAGNEDPAVRKAAVRALSDWPGAAAAPHLLKIIRNSNDRLNVMLALRGYVRIAATAGSRNEKRAVGMFQDVWEVAESDTQQKLILGKIAEIRHPDALKLALDAFGSEGVNSEAALAVVSIVSPDDSGNRAIPAVVARAALEIVMKKAGNESILEKARKQLALLPGEDGNLAKGCPVSASVPRQGGHRAEFIVDGDRARSSVWHGSRWPGWIQIDLLKIMKIDSARTIFYWDGTRYYQYTLSVSADGSKWQTLVDNSGNTDPAEKEGVLHRFDPVEARYVRLGITKNSANEAVHVVELEVYGPAPSAGLK